MLTRAFQRSDYNAPVTRTNHQPAVDRHQRSAARCLEVAPQLVSPLHERDVQWVLEVRLAYDPAVAVRRPAVVIRFEFFEAEHPHATASEMEECGASHAAKAHDDYIVPTRIRHYSTNLKDEVETIEGQFRK